jgi:hypothetical protein
MDTKISGAVGNVSESKLGWPGKMINSAVVAQ